MKLWSLFLAVYELALCSEIFYNDHLTPYHHHGSIRETREAKKTCKHVSLFNESFETFERNVSKPIANGQISIHRFADSVSDYRLPGNLTRHLRHTALGTMAVIDDPYYMLSVLEPGGGNGCSNKYFTTQTSLVRETVAKRLGGCLASVNGGYFKVSTGECLGNVVSDGKVVQTSNNEQNANFGIKQDGSIVVGYLSDSEILNNTFRQLVTGVIWLVRNGSSFVNESMALECSLHEETGRMETFVNVLSARTAIGHDANGRVIIVQVCVCVCCDYSCNNIHIYYRLMDRHTTEVLTYGSLLMYLYRMDL